jgi:hypothetical protein
VGNDPLCFDERGVGAQPPHSGRPTAPRSRLIIVHHFQRVRQLAGTSLLTFAAGGCITGGEEVKREDDTYYVNLLHWEATLADGTAAGSGCLYTEGDYGERIDIPAEVGDTVTLTERFVTFPTTYDDWGRHRDVEYWCERSDGRRRSSIPNAACWKALSPEETTECAGEAGVNVELLGAEIMPPGNYPADDTVAYDADGFRLTFKVLAEGEQCVSCLTPGDFLAFTIL